MSSVKQINETSRVAVSDIIFIRVNFRRFEVKNVVTKVLCRIAKMTILMKNILPISSLSFIYKSLDEILFKIIEPNVLDASCCVLLLQGNAMKRTMPKG